MKQIMTVLAATIFLGISCDDSPAVGSGEPFSSLSSKPTGLEMAQAMLVAVAAAPYTRTSVTDTKSTYDITCVPTGTGHSENQDFTIGSNNSGGIRASYNACSIALTLNKVTFQEKVSGDFASVVEAEDRARISTSFSVSGDIGFSVDCSIPATRSTSDVTTYDGQCVFRDSEGTTIVMPGSDYPNIFSGL